MEGIDHGRLSSDWKFNWLSGGKLRVARDIFDTIKLLEAVEM